MRFSHKKRGLTSPRVCHLLCNACAELVTSLTLKRKHLYGCLSKEFGLNFFPQPYGSKGFQNYTWLLFELGVHIMFMMCWMTRAWGENLLRVFWYKKGKTETLRNFSNTAIFDFSRNWLSVFLALMKINKGLVLVTSNSRWPPRLWHQRTGKLISRHTHESGVYFELVSLSSG